MKNRIIRISAVALVFALFVGCSKEQKQVESGSVSEVETTTTVASEATPTPTPLPSPTPTPTPRLVKVVKYESVGGDWVTYQTDEFDENGNKILTTTKESETTYDYNENNQCVAEHYVSDIATQETNYFYEGELLTKRTQIMTLTEYDSETEFESSYEYDETGKISVEYYTNTSKYNNSVSYYSERRFEYEYDSEGNLIKTTGYANENGEYVYDSTKTFEYGKSGNLVREIYDSKGYGVTTSIYEYDAVGNKIKETIEFDSYSLYASDRYDSYEYEYFYE